MDVWKKVLDFVMKNGEDFKDENSRICREYLDLTMVIEGPEDIDVPMKHLKKIKKFVYPSLSEIEYVMFSKNKNPAYRYVYGERLFNYEGFDQINDYIIPLLKKNPYSRRGALILWDVKKDSDIFEKNIPGLVMLFFKIHKNKLNLTATIRSNDLFFGLPTNIYQINMLQKKVADKLGCNIGSLTIFSHSAHIFKDQFQYIKEVLKK